MTTVNMPAPFRLPTYRGVRATVQTDPDVAKVAIVAAAVVVVALIAGLSVVAILGGDLGAIAAAVSVIASAVTIGWVRVRTSGNGNGGTT